MFVLCGVACGGPLSPAEREVHNDLSATEEEPIDEPAGSTVACSGEVAPRTLYTVEAPAPAGQLYLGTTAAGLAVAWQLELGDGGERPGQWLHNDAATQIASGPYRIQHRFPHAPNEILGDQMAFVAHPSGIGLGFRSHGYSSNWRLYYKSFNEMRDVTFVPGPVRISEPDANYPSLHWDGHHVGYAWNQLGTIGYKRLSAEGTLVSESTDASIVQGSALAVRVGFVQSGDRTGLLVRRSGGVALEIVDESGQFAAASPVLSGQAIAGVARDGGYRLAVARVEQLLVVDTDEDAQLRSTTGNSIQTIHRSDRPIQHLFLHGLPSGNAVVWSEQDGSSGALFIGHVDAAGKIERIRLLSSEESRIGHVASVVDARGLVSVVWLAESTPPAVHIGRFCP